jgi:mono/diheme cytochrome c family protein
MVMRNLMLSILAAAPLLWAAPLHAQGPGGNELPPGEGREVVAVACSQCHRLNAVTQLREGATAWRYQIYDMIERGAQVTPSEMDAAVKYLATHFGPGVNVPPSPPVTLPDGQGKEVVEGGCGLCHGMNRALAANRSPSDWQSVVKRMVFLGAPLSDDQAKAAVAYLSAHFGMAEKTAAAK